MKRFFTLSLLLSAVVTYAQTYTADFEFNNMPLDTFWDGQDSTGYHSGHGMFFHSQYDTNFGGYWADGFAISTVRDSVDGTFGNLFGSRSADGHMSDGYAVVSAFDTTEVKYQGVLIPEGGIRWNSMYINNTTYAHFVMENGNAIAKKFGGDNGTDPDYFFIRIISSQADTLDVYLADFRSDNSSEDYILSDWTYIDLSSLHGERLSFQLFSSDVGGFGINTPAFFCIDDLSYDFLGSTPELSTSGETSVHYTTSGPVLTVDRPSNYQVYNLNGQLITSGVVRQSQELAETISSSGYYLIRVEHGSGIEYHKVLIR